MGLFGIFRYDDGAVARTRLLFAFEQILTQGIGALFVGGLVICG